MGKNKKKQIQTDKNNNKTKNNIFPKNKEKLNKKHYHNPTITNDNANN